MNFLSFLEDIYDSLSSEELEKLSRYRKFVNIHRKFESHLADLDNLVESSADSGSQGLKTNAGIDTSSGVPPFFSMSKQKLWVS